MSNDSTVVVMKTVSGNDGKAMKELCRTILDDSEIIAEEYEVDKVDVLLSSIATLQAVILEESGVIPVSPKIVSAIVELNLGDVL